MKLSNAYFRRTFSLIVIFLFAHFSPATAGVTDNLSKSYSVKSDGTLYIDSDVGAIEVTTNSKEVVNVDVEREANVFSKSQGRDILDHFKVSVVQDGNDVRIEGKFEQGARGFFSDIGRKLNVNYSVSVPSKYNLNLKTAGGSIHVADLEGDVRAKTAGGSLHFGKIRGEVNGKTAGGSIEVQSSDGDVNLETAGGSIDIGPVNGDVFARTAGGSISVASANGDVKAKTAGGSVNIGLVKGYVDATTSGGSVEAHLSNQLKENCNLTTSAGSVRITLPEGLGVDIDARTSGGKVHFDMPIEVVGDLEKSAIRGSINGGGPTVRLRTSAGNIYIEKQNRSL